MPDSTRQATLGRYTPPPLPQAMITNPTAVFFVLAAVVWLAVVLEARYTVFKSVGSAFIGILLGLILSNTGVVPGSSPAYDFLVGPGVSAGIVLILLSVDLRTVMKAGPTMLAAFGVGAVGTATGATVGAFLLQGSVGPETWKLGGQYAATYTGGGANFAAVGAALDTSSELFAAGIAADVIITALWMMTCLVVPVLFARGRARETQGDAPDGSDRVNASDGPETTASEEDTGALQERLYAAVGSVRLSDIGALATIVLGCLWVSGWLGDHYPLPAVLWLTTLALLLAQIPLIQGIRGAAVVGNYLILIFLASNGAKSVVANIMAVGAPVVYFAMITVGIHGAIIFGLGRLVGLDLRTLAVASQANIGGPASAMAIASARGYTEKLLPGVAVGLMGYALGNYLGLALAALLRGALGG